MPSVKTLLWTTAAAIGAIFLLNSFKDKDGKTYWTKITT